MFDHKLCEIIHYHITSIYIHQAHLKLQDFKDDNLNYKHEKSKLGFDNEVNISIKNKIVETASKKMRFEPIVNMEIDCVHFAYSSGSIPIQENHVK